MTARPRSKRPYHSPIRKAAVLERRRRILQAALQLLREVESVSAFTLEAVAASAGVTRLTVYNQFGSRRALMEASFDHLAGSVRTENLDELAALDPPETALTRVVDSFCRFWRDPAVMRLQEAVGTDSEFDGTLGERHERRRRLLNGIVRRADPKCPAKLKAEVVDTLFALTSPQMYRLLDRKRSRAATCRLITEASLEAFRRLSSRS